jgi:transposase
LGFTLRQVQTGIPSISRDIFRISNYGDGEVRNVLYEAASVVPAPTKKLCGVKSWGLRIAGKRDHKLAVAVARKLAEITHRMWLDGSQFCFAGALIFVNTSS